MNGSFAYTNLYHNYGKALYECWMFYH